MKRGYLVFYLLISFLFSLHSTAKEVLHSSVAPEFPEGLHAKYLQYIADKMDMELDIAPMPFARRIKELYNGKIDLMVGMRWEKGDIDDIIYLHPGYEKLRQTFFVLAKDKDRFASAAGMNTARVAVTNSAKYYPHIKRDSDIPIVAVSTLRQKIELLLVGRIDSFIHYEDSTLPLLESMGLKDRVIVALYQPNNYEEYHIAISRKSKLFHLKDDFEKVIRTAVANNDFAKIRSEHYKN